MMGLDTSRCPMPAERPLHVIAMTVVKHEGNTITNSMVLSYRAGCSREEAIGGAMLAAEREKPGFSVSQWLIYSFEDAPAPDRLQGEDVGV